MKGQLMRTSRTSGSPRGDWRIAAALVVILTVGGLIAFTQFKADDTGATSDDVALTGSGRCVAPREARADSPRARSGWYVDQDGATQHIGDGAVQIPAETRRRCGGRWTRPSVNPSATTDPVATTDPATDPSEEPGNGGGDGDGGNNGGGNNGGDGDGGNNGGDGDGGNNGGDGDGGNNGGGEEPGETTPPATTPPATTPPPLEILGNNCDESNLPPHDGFQNGDRCVSTSFGEVADQASNPTLLITEAPAEVGVNEPFEFRVSTRNLQRDRFLAAGQGGYYVESAFLNEDGITRGHIHSSCRILNSTDEAPDPEPVPAFFVATEDSQGSRTPDTVTIRVPGLATAGLFQCGSWAGDGSHRIPMMHRANQMPAFDVFRLQVG
jgi:hypothetical protein